MAFKKSLVTLRSVLLVTREPRVRKFELSCKKWPQGGGDGIQLGRGAETRGRPGVFNVALLRRSQRTICWRELSPSRTLSRVEDMHVTSKYG